MIAACIFPAFVASAATTTGTDQVGSLKFEREHFVNDGPPDIHFANQWKKNRIKWISRDGKLIFTLEDDGSTLTPSYQFTAGLGEASCWTLGYSWSYPKEQVGQREWNLTVIRWLDESLRSCSKIVEKKQRSIYVAEFLNASNDFAPAIAKMKRAALEDFGGWRRRCLKIKIDREVSPFPRTECVRYSAKVN